MGSAIQQVSLTLVCIPGTDLLKSLHHPHELGRAIDHGRVHHLPLTGLRCFQQRGKDTGYQQHAAATKIANEVERHHRPLASTPYRMQRTRNCNVVKIMPSRLRQRSGLSPAGHSGEHQFWISAQALLWTKTELLTDPWPIGVDEHVRTLNQPHQSSMTRRLFQVEHNGLLISSTDRLRHLGVCRAGALYTNHFRTHVGENHPAHRRGTYAREFYDRVTTQSPHIATLKVALIEGVIMISKTMPTNN